jgi:hypothetical protein
MKRTIIITIVVASILAAPAFAHAGVSTWWSRVKSFVAEHSIASADESDAEPEVESDPEPEIEDDGDTPVSNAIDAGMCRVPQQQPETICEVGMGFLCLSTPEKGVAGEEAVIRGTVDRLGSVVTAISVVVQHEYTKETVALDTGDPETSGCWEDGPETRPFCLDEEGYFAARIPLGQLGPHTVSVSASRLSGSSEEKTVRLSRVEAPSLAADSLSFVPDVVVSPDVSDDIVSVTVELLGDCQFCDFIGASTGAVTVTVDNAITSSDGSGKHVSCSTNVEQGGQGRFVIGVPVGEGQNELTVTVCNAAVEENCPSISGIGFSGSGGSEGFTFVRPEPLPAYDSREYPVMEWSFRIGGLSGDACVNVQFNREPIETVCAEGGRFDVTLVPSPGINVATVTTDAASGSKVYPWTFGWGHIVSPFAQDGSVGVDIGIVADRSVQLALPAATFTDVLQPVLGNFLASDGFGSFVSGLMSGVPDARGEEDDGQAVDAMAEDRTVAINDIKSTLPGCVVEAGGFMEGKRIEVVGQPSIGEAKIEDMRLEDGSALFTINADDVLARIRLVTDENSDGVPDKEPLPLKVAFRKAYIDLILTTGKGSDGEEVFLVSSPHTDCDYKSARSCRDMPAALIPKLFLGSATRLDSFVSCDTEGQQVSDDMKELCEAIDSLNAQTGLVSEKVLDAVNGMIYCTGSATLTYMLRGGAFSTPIRVGCFPDDPDDGLGAFMGCTSGTMGKIIGPWLLSAGVVMGSGLSIGESGVLATAGLRVGRPDLFEEMDESLRHPSVGVVVDPEAAGSAMPISTAASEDLLRLALSTNAVNHLFFLLSEQSYEGEPTGLLDIDLSSVFFEKLGFDFVEQCDAFEVPEGTDQKPSSLCNIRPRVGELLGTSLSTYKYFDQKHPLLMRLRGNRALTPHLRIASLDDLPAVPRGEGEWGEDDGDDDSLEGIDTVVELQLGGVEMKFYALEVDEDEPLDDYGNSSLLLDDDGNPIIRSMRPEDSDPDNGQIISFDLTLLLALAVGDVATNPDDPSQSIISIRPLADRTRLVLSPISGSNSTTVPSDSLLPSLANKLSYAIDIFSAADKAIKVPVPKRIALAPDTPSPDSLMSALGLRSIALGADGLSITMDEKSSSIAIDIDGIIRQIVQQGGERVESNFPRN